MITRTFWFVASFVACAMAASSRLRGMIPRSFDELRTTWKTHRPSELLARSVLQNLDPEWFDGVGEVEDPDVRLALHGTWDQRLRDIAALACGHEEACTTCLKATLQVTQQWAEWLVAEADVTEEHEQPVVLLSQGLRVAAGKLDPDVAQQIEGFEVV